MKKRSQRQKNEHSKSTSFLSKIKSFPATSFIYGTLLGVTVSFFLFFMITRQLPSRFLDSRTITEVTKGLNEKYIFKVLTKNINPDNNQSIIVWGNDKNIQKACFSKEGVKMIKYKPIFDIYKKNDFSILSLIPYFKQDYIIYSSFTFDVLDKDYFDKAYSNLENNPAAYYWIADVKVEDLNLDGTDEIVVKAYSYMCGSGGIQFQFILNDSGNGLKVTTTLPSLAFQYENQEIPITKKLNIQYADKNSSVLHTDLDSYIGYKDLDGEGAKELIIGYPIWIVDGKPVDNECHKCAHTWLIGVYKFNGKEFIIDNNWNYGLFYKTPTKITLGDAQGYPHFDENLFNLISVYYFDCEVCNTFYNGSRVKSELMNIVEDKYAKFPSKDRYNIP